MAEGGAVDFDDVCTAVRCQYIQIDLRSSVQQYIRLAVTTLRAECIASAAGQAPARLAPASRGVKTYLGLKVYGMHFSEYSSTASAAAAKTALTANIQVLQFGQLEHRFRQDAKSVIGNVELS